VILVTHGHGDHTSDVSELANRTGATVLGPAGLIATMIDLGWVASDKAVRFGKGCRVNPAGPQISITQVRAEHSSEVTVTDPATKKTTTYPGGEPCGFIVEMENGVKIYHMGDTGLFGDMRFIGEYDKPDLIMIPIGGHFVMDPRGAAYATEEMLKPKFARQAEFLAAAGAAPRSVVQHVLEVPDAAGEVEEHLLRQLRNLPQELPEIDPIDHEHAQVGLGLHGSRAWLAIEQAHLAEKLTGPQPAPLVLRDRHQRGPVDDDEEFVPGLTLPGEDGPLRNLHDLGDVGDGAELAHATRLEDGDPFEVLDLLLTGGPKHFEDVADQSH